MTVDRRTALGLLGLGVASTRLQAAHQHMAALQARPQAYQLQFFTPQENALLDRLAEMIIPADEHSPGAREAQVSHYIDLVAANSPAPAQTNWKTRLAAFDELAAAKHGKPFLELGEAAQAELLNALAAAETKPSTPAEQFFVDVRKATLFAYYTSPVGLVKELNYQGNKALAAFPGCPHGPAAHNGHR